MALVQMRPVPTKYRWRDVAISLDSSGNGTATLASDQFSRNGKPRQLYAVAVVLDDETLFKPGFVELFRKDQPETAADGGQQTLRLPVLSHGTETDSGAVTVLGVDLTIVLKGLSSSAETGRVLFAIEDDGAAKQASCGCQ